MDKLLEA
ncbi:hypothetical protein LINPERHAP1_LOCUS34971 [Linum perenne]